MSTRISHVPAHRLPILYRDALPPMMMRSLQAFARDVGVFCNATPLHSIETIRAWRCQSKASRASAR